MKRAISGPNLSGNGRLAAVQREKQLQKCWIPADSVGTEGDVRKAECDLLHVDVVSEESEKKVSPVGNIYAMPPNVGTTARKVGENDGTWVDAETWWTETFIQVMYWISKYGSWVMCNVVIKVVTVSRCPRRATCISLKHIPTSQLDARERTIGGKTLQLGKWDHSGSAWMQHKSGSEWIHKWVCVFVIEQICARATEPIIEQENCLKVIIQDVPLNLLLFV